MNAREVLALLVCLSFAVNVGDWLLIRRGSLAFVPRSGPWRFVFGAWTILLAVLTALCLLRVISIVWLFAAGAAWMLCSQTCAVVSRHTEGRMKL